MSDLKPCPFCGDDGDKGRQEVTQMTAGRNKFVRIICRSCGCMCPEHNWNRRAQPAQAGQVLTDEEIAAEIRSRGQMVNGVKGDGFMQGARWAEQSVLARVARVPTKPKALTIEQCVTFAKLAGIRLSPAQFSGVLEAEVSEFDLQTFANLCIGIVGEKGGQ